MLSRVIGNRRITGPAEKMATKFQHIVGATCFTGITSQVFRAFLRVEKMLFITAASRSKGVMVNHGMPEKL